MKTSINSVSWNRRIAVRFPAEARDLSLLPSNQTGSGAQLASYSVGTGGSFSGSEAVRGARLTTDLHPAPSLRMSEVITHFSICLHGVHKDNFTFTFINQKLRPGLGHLKFIIGPRSVFSEYYCYTRRRWYTWVWTGLKRWTKTGRRITWRRSSYFRGH